MEFSEFNGLLQVNNVLNVNVVLFGLGILLILWVVIILEVIDNLEEWEFILVEIIDVIFFEGGIYNGLKILEDVIGIIGMFM